MMDKIYTARDYARQRDGVQTVRERIRVYQQRNRMKGLIVPVADLEKGPLGAAVQARIWQGSWIADCDVCGGAEFVDPDEPLFFCWGCGNRQNGRRPRPAVFPENRVEIEAKVLERPVDTRYGLDELQQAEAARAVIVTEEGPLTRSWWPGETLEELGRQQDAALEAHRRKAGK